MPLPTDIPPGTRAIIALTWAEDTTVDLSSDGSTLGSSTLGSSAQRAGGRVIATLQLSTDEGDYLEVFTDEFHVS